MIATLRRRHLWMATGMALAGPLLLVLGWAANRGEPPGRALPPALQAEPNADLGPPEEHRGLWGALPIVTRLWEGDGGAWVELQPETELRRPDLLVYWIPSLDALGRFPERSRFLGRLSGTEARRFLRPSGRGGALVLYSLGHQERVATAVLPTAPHAQRRAAPWD